MEPTEFATKLKQLQDSVGAAGISRWTRPGGTEAECLLQDWSATEQMIDRLRSKNSEHNLNLQIVRSQGASKLALQAP
eukprot:12107727-Prorocentrum_lima.AAC.1